MKFSAQEEYGLRLLIQIGRAEKGRSVTIPELSRIEELSEPHVAKLLMILRKAGFIKSARGQSGGYSLAMEPAEIVVGDVLKELGGRIYDENFCHRHSGLVAECTHAGDCAIQGLWEEVQQAVDGVVNRRTLGDLLALSHKGGLLQVGFQPRKPSLAKP